MKFISYDEKEDYKEGVRGGLETGFFIQLMLLVRERWMKSHTR